MSEIKYGRFGTYPEEWKRPDPVNFTVHVIYHRDNFHGPEPIPCDLCKKVILEHEDAIQKHIDNNQWVFVKHANHTQEYGMTSFYDVLKEFDEIESKLEKS